ncbi:hypothetical protein ACGFMM_19565 [Streptomyces sp. NPDC048604]|uniref:hypothetical protein n=1 Tax=Streptomyces sp. NPDC048604 TaxID=3365578 RepID=UPI0037162860
MRPAQGGSAEPSQTPIYDRLYAEYRRAFRTLPGDRSGEDELHFRSFGVGGYAGGSGFTYPRAWQAALPPAPRRGL